MGAAIVSLFGMVSCLGHGSPRTEGGTSPDPSPSPASSPAEGSGRLAYVGGDGNVWVTSLAHGWTERITSDATTGPEGQGRSYHRVAWLRDGSLAFAAVERHRDDARAELFLQRAPERPPRLLAQNEDHFVIYLYGAPPSCLARPGCPSLAYLIEEESGVGLHLITTDRRAVDDRLVTVGRPFYLSWSSDGRQILWHTGGAERDNTAAEIGLYDVAEGYGRILPYAPGAFTAPAWSPDGGQWLSVVAVGTADHLQSMTVEGATTLATTDRGEMAFVWAPDGSRIAYAQRDAPISDAFGPVHVMDVATGATRRVTDAAFDVLGFFWSPDGERLAYLSRLDLPDDVWMQWRAVDLRADEDRGFTAFHPTPLMRFVVHSFSQYAQSHRFWSPDGRHLVYADRDDADGDRVWVIDVQAEKGAEPILIGAGSIGVWSWQ